MSKQHGNCSTLVRAIEITGGLSKPSKMPGRGFSLPALFSCPRGRELRKRKGTTCSKCYALRGNYQFANVKLSLATRFGYAVEATKRKNYGKLWINAMALLIERQSPLWFRWHDSGDVFSEAYLKLIIEVAKATPDTKHWLPTREHKLLNKYLQMGRIPSNLTVRFSEDTIGGEGLNGYTETLTSGVMPIKKLKWSTYTKYVAQVGGLLCQSKRRGNKCGPCRACWNPKVKHIVYPAH